MKKISKVSKIVGERANHYLDFEEPVRAEELKKVDEAREKVAEWVKQQSWHKNN